MTVHTQITDLCQNVLDDVESLEQRLTGHDHPSIYGPLPAMIGALASVCKQQQEILEQMMALLGSNAE